ncbi:universal stress protein [Streptomyces sp. F63]|uniref:universal stress protein n=1 Tax=Streptomyces sp. F63 TaxID=2824887 RepID=UPI001B372E76|nr:universal stress protein [Streptomyces sp. F63]MBQ0988323.1 universal stress protein [Streptomyces sp. F63]
MLHPVVAGVDGSPQSMTAAEWAAREAGLRGRPLRILCAREALPREAEAALGPQEEYRWAEERLLRLERRVRERHPDLPVDVRREPDSPVQSLLDQDAELLVLGSRGLTGMVGHLMGSVSLAVVGRSERPVVLVRAGYDPGAPEHGVVAVGFDYHHEAEEPVRFAYEAAAARGARVRAVHVWDAQRAYGWATIPQDMEVLDAYEGPARRYLADAVAPWRERYPEVETVEEVVRGNAGPGLIAAGAGTDLLVAGHRVRGKGRASPLGHVTHAVLHHAPCPVAVVPHG